MKKMLIGKVLATNLARLMAERPDLNTQIKVAKKSGIGQTTVGRILRNEVSATADNIEAIACAFGLSVGELLSTQTNVGEPRHINSRERMLFDLFASLSRDEQNKLIHALEKNETTISAWKNFWLAGKNQTNLGYNQIRIGFIRNLNFLSAPHVSARQTKRRGSSRSHSHLIIKINLI